MDVGLLVEAEGPQNNTCGARSPPAGALAKYCDEYVCLCVYLSARLSPEPHARSLPHFLCMLPMSVAWSSSGMLTTGRIACRREGVAGVHSAGEV